MPGKHECFKVRQYHHYEYSMHCVYCVCSNTEVVFQPVPPSVCPPPVLPSFISGSIGNTARSEGKHTQTNSPHHSKIVYVGWTDIISPVHCLHRAILHFANTEKITHIGSIHFSPSHRSFVSLLSVT